MSRFRAGRLAQVLALRCPRQPLCINLGESIFQQHSEAHPHHESSSQVCCWLCVGADRQCCFPVALQFECFSASSLCFDRVEPKASYKAPPRAPPFNSRGVRLHLSGHALFTRSLLRNCSHKPIMMILGVATTIDEAPTMGTRMQPRQLSGYQYSTP